MIGDIICGRIPVTVLMAYGCCSVVRNLGVRSTTKEFIHTKRGSDFIVNSVFQASPYVFKTKNPPYKNRFANNLQKFSTLRSESLSIRSLNRSKFMFLKISN